MENPEVIKILKSILARREAGMSSWYAGDIFKREAEALKQAIATLEKSGWDRFRDTVKKRFWDHNKDLSVADAIGILNTHHQGHYDI